MFIIKWWRCKNCTISTLTGYEDMVMETARETSEKIEIDDELKSILDSKIQILIEQVNKKTKVSITYFVNDLKKGGGAYIVVEGIINKIDLYKQCMYLEDKTEIPINDIIDISENIFTGCKL